MLATRSAKQAGRSASPLPAGFTRAFHTQTGMTPRQYKKARPVIPRHDDTLATDFSELMLPQLQPEAAPPEASPPSVPATQTWNRINDFHVLVWLYRGAARVMVGERTRRLRRGDAIWLPAGVGHGITLSRSSLLTPSRISTAHRKRDFLATSSSDFQMRLSSTCCTLSSPITALFALRRTTRTGSRTHFSSMPRGREPEQPKTWRELRPFTRSSARCATIQRIDELSHDGRKYSMPTQETSAALSSRPQGRVMWPGDRRYA